MVGERLKELRNEKKVSQQELARALSVSQSTVAMWETNKREPDIETIMQIATFFDYPVAFLLNDSVKIGKEFSSDDSSEHCCPICGYEYIYLEDVVLVDFHESQKSSGYALKFSCEAEHVFYIVIENYKGCNYMTYTDEHFHPIKPVLKEVQSVMDAKFAFLDKYGRKAVRDLLDTEYERCMQISAEKEKPAD